MAYYDALITAWHSTTQPPSGVNGSGLAANDTTQQKLNKINAWTVNNPQKVFINATDVYNRIVLTEYNALTTANQTAINNLLSMGMLDASPGTSVRSRFIAIFPSGTQTFANLQQYVAPFDGHTTDWCMTNGYPSHGGRRADRSQGQEVGDVECPLRGHCLGGRRTGSDTCPVPAGRPEAADAGRASC